MREHEIQMILTWIGFRPGVVITEQMIREAIRYAYQNGYSDAGDHQ